MVKNHRVSPQVFLFSTIFIYALVMTQLVGTAQAESSNKFKDNNSLDELSDLDEQALETQPTAAAAEELEQDISMIQTDSTPLSKLRFNPQREAIFDSQKQNMFAQSKIDPFIRSNKFDDHQFGEKDESNSREQFELPTIMKVTENTVKIQDGSIIQDDSALLNTISQNYEESKSNQEEIATKLKSLRETQERHMREEQDLLKISSENDYLQDLQQKVKNANKFVGSDTRTSNQLSMDDVDDDIKKLINPEILNNVIEREKYKTEPGLQKIYDDQKKREQEAYLNNQKRIELERANYQKIQRDLELQNEYERKQDEEMKQTQLEQIRRQEEEQKRQEEEDRRQQEERERQQQEEELQRQRQAEEEEARRLAQEEQQQKIREDEERRKEQIHQQEIARQEQIRVAQEQESQKKEQEEIQKKLQAEKEAEEQARQEQAQKEAEGHAKQEQAQKQAEEQAKQDQAEKERVEQEKELERQRQIDEQNKINEQQLQENNNNPSQNSQVPVQINETNDQQNNQQELNTSPQDQSSSNVPENNENQDEEDTLDYEDDDEDDDNDNDQVQQQQEIQNDQQQQQQQDEGSHQDVSNDQISQQSPVSQPSEISSEQQGLSLQEIEDQKRQQLKEQKLKSKQAKENQSSVQASTEPPQVQETSDKITQVDEFGNEFSFKKSERIIPLTQPSFMNDIKQDTKLIAGQKLQAKISKENGHHLDKKSIKEQRERAEQFQFVSQKNKGTQVTPNGETIEKSKGEKATSGKFLKKKDDVVDSSTLASNVAILCNDKNKASSKSVQHICELCEVGEVFQLTDENWFKVGLSHNHKKEYQDLLNQVNEVFGKTNLIAGFSKHGDICLSSEQIFNSVNIDLALKTFTYNSLNKYQLEKNPIFNFQAEAQVDEFTFRTSFKKEKKNNEEFLVPEYNNFQMIINGQFFRKIDSSTNLNVLNIVFLQAKLTTFYFGQISINSYSAQVHFQHDEDQRDHDTINIVAELPNDPISFQRQAFKMFSQDNLQKIVQNMQLPRGIQQIENVKIQSMMVTLNLTFNAYQIIMNFDEIVDFQLSLNLNLVGCSGWIMVQKDSLNNQFFLESNNLICQIEEFPDYSRLHIKKTNTNSNYFVRFADDEYLLKQINEDVFYKINTSAMNAGKFEVDLDGLIDFKTTYLHEVKIEIFFEPRILYEVKATIGSEELKTVGEFRAKFTRINGSMNSFVSFTFGAENINDLFHFKKSDLVSTTPKSFYIFYSQEDLNTQNLQFLKFGEFGPSNQEIWVEGVYLQYVFDFEDNCNIGLFLTHHKAQVNNLHVKGYYKDKYILLSGVIDSNVAIANLINLQNISINIPVSLDEDKDLDQTSSSRVEKLSKIQIGRFYIQSDFQLKVTDSKVLSFNGILNYQKDNQGYLQAECREPWVNAFEKEDLLLSEILFKGKMNEDVHRLESFTINSLSMFGGECFIEMENDILPRFDVDRCFYGNSQIKVNFKDFTQDLFSSYVNFINPQNILQVLLGYNPVKFATTVSKPIVSMQFPQGLSITYTQSSIRDPATNQVHIPRGFTLTGHAELLGLKGHTVLNINHDKYLLGLFKFDELTFAGGNVVIIETEGGHQNSIILRLQKDNPSLGEINQMFFQPKAFILNLQRSIQVSVTRDQGYIIEVLDKFFGCQDDIAIRISSPFINEIQNAKFKLMALFMPAHLKRINAQLVSLTKEWMNRTQNLFADLAQRVSEVQKDLITLNKILCDKETCPYNQQCISTPRSECIKYHQKQVCLDEQLICLEENIVCSQEVEICTESAVTCSHFSAEDPTTCELYEETCVQFIRKCNAYESVCATEQIKVCTKNKFVDDPERCIVRQMVCDVELVKDTNCQMECERKRDEFETKTRVFDKFTNALTNFQRRNQKFTEMVNYILDNSDSFVSIIEAKFNQDLNELLNVNNITVEFSVQSFTIIERVGQDIQNYRLDNYDFRNEEQMIRLLFRKMQLYWASQHSIDEILIAADSTIILHDILNRINIQAQNDANDDDPQMVLLMCKNLIL